MTQENVHLYIPHLEALRDGELEFNLRTLNDDTWDSCTAVDFTLPPEYYRRRPAVVRVPLEASDWDGPTWWVRNTGGLRSEALVIGHAGDSVIIMGPDAMSVALTPEKALTWQRSRDRVKWEPCSKEVPQAADAKATP